MRGLAYAGAMARYNRWMNERLYECCARLPDAERKRDRDAFFKSIHGTLNHLLLADRIWMGRFEGRPYAVRSLAQELYPDFEELKRERVAMDAAIERWVGSLSGQDLDGDLVYTSVANPREPAIRCGSRWRTSSTTRRTIAASSRRCSRNAASIRA